ncbi:MAG: glutamate 5-kinase [Oscillospiraceae bacterium]|nr:glutamate 5-kinase [Oscillospiraceae bacterium]MDD4367334.1 glutamate 5-kinase [Oscillospiraceae bacterium]
MKATGNSDSCGKLNTAPPQSAKTQAAAARSLRQQLRTVRRLVVKVGTSTVTHPNGAMDLLNIERLCRTLADLQSQGRQVILVSSGAIAVGMNRLRERKRPREIPEKQAYAAIGQAILINGYNRILAEYGQISAQVLLTRDDTDNPEALRNIHNTFMTLLDKGVIPIVNENDTVSTHEVFHNGTFGDNDKLSAIVARILEADLLVLMSDIDGLYNCDPHKYGAEACLIDYVPKIDQEVAKLGGDAGSLGTGGMKTKLAAARIAGAAGIPTVITQGHRPGDLDLILSGETIGTLFAPAPLPLSAADRQPPEV